MTEAAPLGATAEPRAGDDTPTRQLAGKYMIFKLGDEEYGLEILKVRELIGLQQAVLAISHPPQDHGDETQKDQQNK